LENAGLVVRTRLELICVLTCFGELLISRCRKIHGWSREPSYKVYQSTSQRPEHRLDSTGKTNWIKIKIKSKTVQEFIKIRQRLQLTLYNAFYNSSPMIKSTNSPHTAFPNILAEQHINSTLRPRLSLSHIPNPSPYSIPP
jgi:hypothetical protein